LDIFSREEIMPPEIDYKKCQGCGKCVDACAEDVFFGFGGARGEKPKVTYPEVCFHCNLCVSECQVAGAISLRVPLTMSVLYK
jgi:NAD-dependent dihydropyrimidine dehydrogenase PreA subunit